MSSKTDIVTDDYKEKYGFSDPVESYAVQGIKGLSEKVVQEIVRLHDEPAWMEQIRMKALKHFLDREPPAWAPDLKDIDFQNFYYYARPTAKAADSWDQLPDYIKKTYDKLGITEAEKKFLAGVGAVYESEAVYHSIQGELEKKGVVFTDTVTALKQYPDIMKKYFGTVVPYQDNYIAALQTAVWSAGSFVYVPEGVKVPMILQAYFRINERRMGQFERTLIVAEPYSEVSYNEGCLPADELVSKGHSLKPIESITRQELVVTHEGRRQPVTDTYVHAHDGQMLTIIPQSGASAFRLTPEHPVLAIRRDRVAIRKGRNGWLPEASTSKLMATEPEFIEAGKLEAGDFIVYVAPTETKDDPLISDALLKVFGIYLAEGGVSYNISLDRDYLHFSFGKSAAEKRLADELLGLIHSLGERASLQKSRGKYYVVGSYSKKLIDFCRSNGGSGASTKVLSERMMQLPAERQMLFLGYYLKGDGNRYSKKGRSLMIRASTASKILAFQLQETLARSGMYSNINLRKGSEDEILGRKILRGDQYVVEYTEGKKWSAVRRNGNRFLVPVKRILSEPFNGRVYNIGVKSDESYLVKGFVVHNCSAPVYSAQSLHSAIVEIIARKGSLVKYTTLQNWSRDVLNLVTKRAHAHEDATVSWVDFNGGCLVAGTEVLSNNDVKRIEDVDVGSKVYSLDGDMNFVSSEVIAKRENPPQEVYRLTTLNYREVEATANHPFLTLRKSNGIQSMGWTPLSGLRTGDLLAVSGMLPDHGRPFKIEFTHSSRVKKRMRIPAETSDDLMWLLGFYLGDGTIESGRVAFCVPDTDDAFPRVKDTIAELFGLDGSRHARNKVMFRVSSKDFADFIETLGVTGDAKSKRVPDWVYKLPISQKRAFIDGYIAADGHVKKGHRNISLCSASLALLKQVKSLAISAGLNPSKISTWKANARFPNGSQGTYTNYYLYFLDKKVEHPVHFVPLTKIEPVGRKATYDIEVAGTKNFVANGVIVHNSRLTRKYPSVYLVGPRAKADIISVAYAGPGQVQDTGAKAIHLAKDTTSKIVSRSVSKGGGHTAYRGLLHIAKGAKNVKSSVRCVKPDTLILGDNKPISEYQPGNLAIGMSGSNSVSRTYISDFDGAMVKIAATGLLPIEVTPDHPMLVSRSYSVYPRVTRSGKPAYSQRITVGKPQWKPASELTAKHSLRDGDYLLLPRLKGSEDTKSLDLAKFAKNDRGLKVMLSKGHSRNFPLDVDTARVLGLYVAEGYSSQDKVKFALNSDEIELYDIISKTFGRLGYSVKAYKSKTENGMEVVVFSGVLARALTSWCGKGAPNKRIPDFILLHKDMNIVDSFLTGYLRGDGTRALNSAGERNVDHIVTTSRMLAIQTQLLGARKGLFFRITKALRADMVQGRRVKAHEKFDVRATVEGNIHPRIDEQFFYVPIRKIVRTPYRGPVYNLETSDHTYLLSNAVSHNCDALLLDPISTTATYPYMEIQEDDATVTHEASVGKVGEEQLFYLMSRGISEGDALSMVVNGFMEPFAKELPMTYAVEFNRLMSLEMTNAVG